MRMSANQHAAGKGQSCSLSTLSTTGNYVSAFQVVCWTLGTKKVCQGLAFTARDKDGEWIKELKREACYSGLGYSPRQ